MTHSGSNTRHVWLDDDTITVTYTWTRTDASLDHPSESNHDIDRCYWNSTKAELTDEEFDTHKSKIEEAM